jgi:chromosome partitioning protein
MSAAPAPHSAHFDDIILAQGREISRKLNLLRLENFPPNAQKSLREFSMAEAAQFLGTSPSNLKKIHLEGKAVSPNVLENGRRSYTAAQMMELRHYLDQNGRGESRRYLPWRKPGEKLQVIAVVNFKGGSGKTTTAIHLAQHLALTGHRVLALDLDPQASMSALFGIQPELDRHPSVYEAIRYDEQRQPLSAVIRPTNFPGLDVVPASLELQEYEYDTPVAMQNKASPEGKVFWNRIEKALAEVEARYDVVVVDCPPQLGYLTLTALAAASAVLITVHPQMLDLMSMSQFLLMLGDILKTIRDAGGGVELDWFRYLITRYEPGDVPQTQMMGFMQSMLAGQMLKNPMVKSTAISDAGLTKQTLYEVERAGMNRATYERAMGALDAVNGEIRDLIHTAWGRVAQKST